LLYGFRVVRTQIAQNPPVDALVNQNPHSA
jgi:hypothetical protein